MSTRRPRLRSLARRYRRPGAGCRRDSATSGPARHPLDRAMGLLQATATNVISMVGVGPFLTIPFMVAAMNGPHVIYAWIAGGILAVADGLVYAQLGAALPGSGGGYLYLREAFQPFGLGRLMAFLFIFQTVLVAPLSVAGGAVGFADYVQFVWTDLPPLTHHLIAAAVCIASTALLWRKIEDIGRLSVVMLVVVLRHRGLGDRGRALQLLAGAGVRLPGACLHLRRRAASRASAPRRCWRCTATAATTRSATSATRSRTRRARCRARSSCRLPSWPCSTC